MTATSTASASPDTAAAKVKPSPLDAAMQRLDPPDRLGGTTRADLHASGKKLVDDLKYAATKVAEAVTIGIGAVKTFFGNIFKRLQDDTRQSWIAKNQSVGDENLRKAGEIASSLSGTSTSAAAGVAKLNAITADAAKTVVHDFAGRKAAKNTDAGISDDPRVKTDLTMRVLTVQKEATRIAHHGAKVSAVLLADSAAIDAVEQKLLGVGVQPDRAGALVAELRKRNADAGGATLSGIKADGLDDPATAKALLEVVAQLNERTAKTAATANAAELKRLGALVDGISGLTMTTAAVKQVVVKASTSAAELHPSAMADDIKAKTTAAAVEKLSAGDFGGVQAVLSEGTGKLGAIRALYTDKLAPLAAATNNGAGTVINAAIEGAAGPANPNNPYRILSGKIETLKNDALEAFAQGRTQEANAAFASAMKMAGVIKAMEATVSKANGATKDYVHVAPEQLRPYYEAAAKFAASMLAAATPSDKELALAQAAFDKAVGSFGAVLGAVNDARIKLATPGINSITEVPNLLARIGKYEEAVIGAFARDFDPKKLRAATRQFKTSYDAKVDLYRRTESARAESLADISI